MDNLYYYTFYLLIKVAKRLNKKDDSPNFGGLMILSSTIFFNFCSILVLMTKKLGNSFAIELLKPSHVRLTCFTIMIVTGIINYMVLMYDHKADRIIEFFNEKFKIQKQNKVKVVLIIVYNILSIIIGIYLSYLIGINRI